MLGQVQLREEIAARLKQAREAAGYYSAEDFCKEKNLSPDEYLPHEAGDSAMRASYIMKYCKLLNITLHWLMFGEDKIKPEIRQKRKRRPSGNSVE